MTSPTKPDHECETPLDGAIQHKWTCKICGKRWEVVGFDDQGNSEYEEIDNDTHEA